MLQGVVDADEKDENEVTGRPAKNLQSYVREVMMAKEKVRYALSAQKGGKIARVYRSARCAGSGYQGIEGLMESLWIRPTRSCTPLSSKGHWTGSMGMCNDAMKEHEGAPG